MAKKKVKENDIMAFELYAILKGAIPIGVDIFTLLEANAYLLADILLWSGCDAKQSKGAMDAISKSVLAIMLRQKEMNNQVN